MNAATGPGAPGVVPREGAAGGRPPRSAQFARAYLGIGEVLVELRSEFPDISVSKIRFLEAEGLLCPARSPSGYRRFSRTDVDQLRYILTAQRDEYLPLRVIKERLATRDADGPATRSGPAEMVGRRELLDAGLDEQQLAELETHGLLKRVGRLYGQESLDVVAAVSALAQYGIQARHLRTVATSAGRDVALIEQLVGPVLRQRGPQARQTADRTATEVAAQLLRLHRSLVGAGLAEAGLAVSEDQPESQHRAGGAQSQHRAGGPQSQHGREPMKGASA